MMNADLLTWGLPGGVLVVLGLSLAAWLYLLFLRGGYWRGDQRLGPVSDRGEPARWPEVAACIPARDESAAIGATIRSHMDIAYPGAYQVVLADDHSSDGTAALAQRAAEGGSIALHITRSPGLAAGWTGKLWALNHAVETAKALAPDAEYLLLTDADITYKPDVLRRLVAKAERERLALVSVMALLDARGWGRLLVPAFVYFFQKLYPFPLINDPRRKTAGAAGGCVLVRRDVLDQAGGLAAIRDQFIDDCALGQLIKGAAPDLDMAKRGIWVGLSRDVESHRDNRHFRDLWNMVARTAFTQLHYSWPLVVGTVAGMALLYLAGPLAVLTWPFHNNPLIGLLGLTVWMLMSVTYLPTLALYRLPAWWALTLPVAGLLYTAMTVSSALRHLRGKGGQWKGRTYSALR